MGASRTGKRQVGRYRGQSELLLSVSARPRRHKAIRPLGRHSTMSLWQARETRDLISLSNAQEPSTSHTHDAARAMDTGRKAFMPSLYMP